MRLPEPFQGLSTHYPTDEDYENVLSVKDPERNAFIGIGCKDFPVDATRRAVGSPLVTMPITGGLMGMEIYDGPVEKP